MGHKQTNTMNNIICKDCRGSRFVTTRDADYVCTGCGLVAMERMIEDCPEWGWYDHNEECRAEVLEDGPVVANEAWLADYLSRIDTIDEMLKSYVESLWKKVYEPRNHKESLLVVCIYHGCIELQRGFTIHQCMNMVSDCNTKHVWEYYDRVGKHIKPMTINRNNKDLADCKRMIYNILDNPDDQRKVIKMVQKMLEEIQDKGCRGAVKASKFNACVVYIACQKNGINGIDTQRFCKDFGIGINAFKKYKEIINKNIFSAFKL